MSADTAAESVQREEELNKINQDRCEKYIRSSKRNVTIKFLYDRLTKLGCDPPSDLMRCLDCTGRVGGFGAVEEIQVVSSDRKRNSIKKNGEEACAQTRDEIEGLLAKQNDGEAKLRLVPEIYLCRQHLRDESHAHEALVHELIHAVDMCRTKMDPIKNCIHMACTEIRAENLSGECHWMREMQNGRLATDFVGHGEKCVKRRAILSVKANPNCADKADEYVEAAFDRCFKDTFPFDRHPNLSFCPDSQQSMIVAFGCYCSL